METSNDSNNVKNSTVVDKLQYIYVLLKWIGGSWQEEKLLSNDPEVRVYSVIIMLLYPSNVHNIKYNYAKSKN